MNTQTIRTAANAMFLARLPQRAALGNTAFRVGIIRDLAKDTGCTIAAASSHYNHAFKRIKESEPELVEGLGRAADKNNGGRKPKQAPVASAPVDELTPDLGVAQEHFDVKRCKDGTLVAVALSFDDARALVQKHAAQKKAKLYWV